MTASITRRNRRSRQAKQASTEKSALKRVFMHLQNPYRPIKALSRDQVVEIDSAAMRLLEDIGIRVLSSRARAFYKRGGADVDESTMQVRFDRAMIIEFMRSAPRCFSMYARNPERNVTMGEGKDTESPRNVVFGTVSGTPFLSDLDRGRRAGDRAGLIELIRLSQHFDVIHILGTLMEPLDISVPLRHVKTVRCYVSHSDKVPFVRSQTEIEIEEAVELVRLSRGISRERMLREPSCYTVSNMNSPLQLDGLMAEGIMKMAELGQVSIVTPFTLAGAMAPISLAGALAQQHAEALGGIVLSQIVRSGSAVVYGGFTSNVDMRSGAPAFGTPEYTQAAIASGQLARLHGVPFRSSNVNASNAPDAQAAYESQMSLWGALMGGCHVLLQGAGWLEGGLVASYEKFIIDIEMLQMMAAFFQPLRVDEAELALSAVREVGPGGHFFGAKHTLERYRDAFYEPLLSDWSNFETWQERGGEYAHVRANKIWKRVLRESVTPELGGSIEEAIGAHVAGVEERVKRE